MGTNYSSQSIESITKITTDVMTNISTNILNNSTIRQKLKQTANIIIENADLQKCQINVTQSAELSASLLMKNTSDLSNAISNEIMNKVIAELTTKATQVNKDLNLGQTNISDMNIRIKNHISNNLKTIVETTIKNSTEIDQDGEQLLRANLRGIRCKNSVFNFDQSFLMSAVSKNIAENIVSSTIQNTMTNEMKQKLKADAEQKNAGLNIAFFLIIIAIAAFGAFAIQSGWFSSSLGSNKEKYQYQQNYEYSPYITNENQQPQSYQQPHIYQQPQSYQQS